MNWLLSYLLTYIMGGLTFVPLILWTLWACSPKVPSEPKDRQREREIKKQKDYVKPGLSEGYGEMKTAEIYYDNDLDVNTVFQGWLTVTPEFYRLPQINADEFKSTAAGSLNGGADSDLPAGSSFIKMVKDIGTSSSEDPDSHEDTSTLAADARTLKQIRKRNRFWGLLKHGNLFLYKDDTRTSVQHVIVLKDYLVTLWPRGLTDGKLFTKYSCVCLLRKEIQQDDGQMRPLTEEELLKMMWEDSTEEAPPGSYYAYADDNHQKEDWYFAFLRASSKPDAKPTDTEADLIDPSLYAKPLFFNTADIMELVQTINSTEGQLSCRWLNAIIGRLFLSVYKTPQYKQYVKNRFDEKLRRIRTPGFLDELQISSIDVGHGAPYITNPKLKELSPEGDLTIEFMIDYTGGIAMEVATKAVLNLGSHFKQRQFDVNLNVLLRRLHGKMEVKMKQMPSNRIWYYFTQEPDMDLFIEPVVSSRSINYNLVTKVIEKRFKDAIRTSLVYPFMDDLVYMRSTDEIFRGGIWDHSAQEPIVTSKPKPEEQELAVPSGRTRSLSSGSDTSFSAPQPIETTTATTGLEPVESLKESHQRTFSDDSSTATSESKVSATLHKNKVTRKLIQKGTALKEKGMESFNLDSDDSELSAAAAQLKANVSTSVSKLKKWYNKRAPPEIQEPKPDTYTPPVMISSRRKRPEDSTPVSSRNASVSTTNEPPTSPSSTDMFISERYHRESVSHGSVTHRDSVSHSTYAEADPSIDEEGAIATGASDANVKTTADTTSVESRPEAVQSIKSEETVLTRRRPPPLPARNI